MRIGSPATSTSMVTLILLSTYNGEAAERARAGSALQIELEGRYDILIEGVHKM